MTSATPKPRAGEHMPEFGCNKKTLYAIADTMIEKLRGCGESAALVRQAIDERDLLREREVRVLALAADFMPESNHAMFVAAVAALAKHGR